MEENIKLKTGKSVAEWIAIVKKQNFQKHGEILKYLKSEHAFTHGYANYVSLKAREADAASHNPDDLIINQYKGKEHLKPIYDKIIEQVKIFGSDVEMATKKASMSLRRKKQFALIQPTTKTRIDLGLKLKGKEHKGRLEGSGPFGTMCTHRVKLTDINEVDQQLINWLKEAYDAAG